jgi:hypothetical protein
MRVFARINHIGWVHLWRTQDAYDAGEASEHFFNGKSDPRWAAAELDETQRARLAGGALVEIEDPGYLDP